MRKVLCIEDDQDTAHEIAAELGRMGFAVECAGDGQQGLELALQGAYDAITLDRMLPGLDGLEVITRLRGAGVRTPVLMISALTDVDDRIRGLRAGGDDYLVKPFVSEEMATRIEVLLRRHGEVPERETLLQVGDLGLDLLSRELLCGEQRVGLSPIEFKLLEFLMRNAGAVVTRALIFESVWGYHFDPGTKLIDVHLTRLRRKLDVVGCKVVINALRGSGFVLVDGTEQ
ncbi:response regulator transcription factor [Pseudomonas sp. DTU_2021_1001937_2_SI_NGA_ILE_001]|uniref:response regulator transcription factor n=1 Tax=Pseudomonas sp. DTU_2021_1001937_2_SI_NGA_ILE_001 TaxID=3077589 RepID=UPI0025E92E4D|nr:response regulator transcription factor [Pseudomonas sp. DTU_2021_1001937_2_SI_NGA_ILE_001]WNW09820.1 response regulator transcription factor [Pseudomonas sp. DTU_2021_1001937_2_SI_NGA_ILE_001]